MRIVAKHKIGVTTLVRNQKGQFLVVPRKENIEKVCNPGGGMDFFEGQEDPWLKDSILDFTPACTAKRELFEETGVEGECFIFLGVVYEIGKGGNNYATHIFLLEDIIPDDFPLKAENGIMPVWMSSDEILRRAAFPKSTRAAFRWASRFAITEDL